MGHPLRVWFPRPKAKSKTRSKAADRSVQSTRDHSNSVSVPGPTLSQKARREGHRYVSVEASPLHQEGCPAAGERRRRVLEAMDRGSRRRKSWRHRNCVRLVQETRRQGHRRRTYEISPNRAEVRTRAGRQAQIGVFRREGAASSRAHASAAFLCAGFSRAVSRSGSRSSLSRRSDNPRCCTRS